jgi:sulfonate transport system permease protein
MELPENLLMVTMDPALEQRRSRTAERVAVPRRAALSLPRLNMLRGLVVPLLILIAWQITVNREVYSRGQLPAPIDVLLAGQELQNIGILVPNVTASLQRVAIGWGVGALVAIALGLLVGFSRTV